ncbi:MAG: GAF domain-containing protein [Cyclobacteriaceae bacterium]|jgi:GAF domain-containing protein|nr:GAF domain-containing protein [Cyclobacteriaceae bacterium]
MAEDLLIDASADKSTKYRTLLPQLEALVQGESDLIANLSNIAAALRQTFGFFWVGFYLVKDGQLVLGPFQGPIACTRIDFGKGVCGAAWERKAVLVVPDVDKFPGHIACSSHSKSEIVLPILKGDEVAMVLDVDSERLAEFDNTDEEGLGNIVRIIERIL